MGVKKLLKQLDPILTKVNLLDLNISKIGIDGHNWIYESLEHCDENLVLRNNISKIAESIQVKLEEILDSGRTHQGLTWSWFSMEQVYQAKKSLLQSGANRSGKGGSKA